MYLWGVPPSFGIRQIRLYVSRIHQFHKYFFIGLRGFLFFGSYEIFVGVNEMEHPSSACTLSHPLAPSQNGLFYYGILLMLSDVYQNSGGPP